ncbi:polysaccharide biosynthesis protein [Methanobacterium paludis]|uniref:Polysaccharide biosynthesis protein n=1 Tax=Methanobacterium paludis (strain DSM 25820 / JCM 18151 / SWAN1) TaxID=868131 RepID=F6D709_METPW|nr:polysaccharide biosynthesis protein [Methanobacterium paludis]
MNEYKVFVQRIGLVGFTNILIALSSIILLPILTKNFTTSDYGIWVQINTTISLIPNLAMLGLPMSMVRYLSAKKEKKEIQEGFYSIASLVFASTIVISALLLLFSKNIAVALFNGNVNIAILLAVIVFLACLNALLLNFFRTFQQMKRYSVFLLIQTYLGVFIVSYFAIKGFSIYTAALGLLIANLIIFVIMISFIISDIGLKIPKFKNMMEYLSFGLPTIPSNLSYWIVDSSDRYAIGIILGTSFVGYYSPGYTLGNIIIMMLAPFSLLLPSLLPNYYDNEEIEKVKTFLKYSLKYFLLIAIPSAFGLSILSKPILTILTTPEIALNGYLITPFVALSALLFGIYGIISNIIVLKKKTKILGNVWIFAAVLNVVLNILLIPYIGIIGAAAATLVSYFIAFIITTVYSFKYFKFDFDLVFIMKSIIASVLMSLCIFLINPSGILNVLITVIIGAVVYMGLLLVLKGIKKEEFEFFKEMLTNS